VEVARRAEVAEPAAAARRRADIGEVAPPPELGGALGEIAAVLERPGDTPPARVGAACRAVGDWAAREGMLATAAEFFGAGARAHPADATLATAAGRVLRRMGRYPQAEGWLRHALSLARAAADREAFARARVGLGNMYMERGAFPKARHQLLSALAFARTHRLDRLEPEVLHDLFATCASAGRPAEAERYAGEAVSLYPAGHPYLPKLAFDVAFLWTERGSFAEAHRVFTALRGAPGGPPPLLVHSALARTAGGIGDERVFLAERAEVLGLVEASEGGEDVAPALVNVAYGALSLGMPELASGAAAHAKRVADARGEGKMRMVAEGLLERVRVGLPHPRPRRDPAPHRRNLAERVVESLATAG
jgi:tetratricopeptide (TPR) repeat protein